MSCGSKRFLLLYGSQTGQAQAIAEEINERAVKRGLQPELYCLSQAEKKFCLEKEPVFVVVVSTTGDGEPPDTVSKFWRKLKRKTVPKDHLSVCHYALLGLGDSNYTNFCNMGKMLNKRLLELGAVQFYPPGFADDGVGLEIVVEPWIDGLLQPLETLLTSKSLTNEPQSDKSSAKCDVDGPTEQTVAVVKSVDETAKSSDIESNNSDNHKKVGTQCLGEQLTNNKIECESASIDGRKVAASCKQDEVSQLNVLKESAIQEPAGTQNYIDGNVKNLTTHLQQTLTVTNSFDDLKTPSTDLVGMSLTLPSVQPPFVDVKIEETSVQEDFPYEKVMYGFKTSISIATVVGSLLLTQARSVKKTIELEISLQDCPELTYQPGDAFGFVCPNDSNEVQWLIERLQLTSKLNKLMQLSIIPGTAKRNPVLPKHVPFPCSVVNYFTHCADIRCVPKKALLCFLASCCSNELEARRLYELSSRQGAKEYTKYITEQYTNFLDVLYFFPSCLPSIGRLIELLPKLQPRYYSAASSPLEEKKLRITFNVEELPSRRWQDGRILRTERFGLATGWFDRVTSPLPVAGVKVPIFPRVLNPFHLPDDPLQPIVMIGPGTGVSPFIGFLQHRVKLRETSEKVLVGKAWLFFGCRHPDKDFLYKDKLEFFSTSGILTHCHVCFSRWTSPTVKANSPRYVQDNMRIHWKELAQWIIEDNAVVYVCGDAKNMAIDVQEALMEVITKHTNLEPGLNPSKLFSELKENGRYLVDAWS